MWLIIAQLSVSLINRFEYNKINLIINAFYVSFWIYLVDSKLSKTCETP